MQSIEDKPVFSKNGFSVLITFAILLAVLFFLHPGLGGVGIFTFVIMSTGFCVVNPNEAKVITFFGKYKGTIRESGFLWTIPLSGARAVPLKLINFNTEVMKVNDLRGNPIEVGAVVVWKVRDAAQACFNVDAYRTFVANQSEIAIRSIVADYPYDSDEGVSLRSNGDEISSKLAAELQQKLSAAGIEISEVRIAHLAYSSEIAAAMLKRQQAVAVLEARKYLVENALSILDSVMQHFEEKGIREISDDKKAEVLNNLLVTLVSEKDANPVVSVG
ncbi:SPFH domain-containing protein [Rickettsiales bacterium]|nr:SPFH domain-containing protein [Rickettsiales bacterium]